MGKGKLIGRIIAVMLAIPMVGTMLGAPVLPLGDLDKNRVSGQEDASHIMVHTLDLEGIETPTIEERELFVSALVEGVYFTAAANGTYRFTITGGAFELCPPQSAPSHPDWWGWCTEIVIYKNRPIYWSGGYWAPAHPSTADWDFSVGDPHNQPTYEAAERIGKGMFVDITLAEDEYVVLVVNDCKGYFSDNSGGIYFSVAMPTSVTGQYYLTIYGSAEGSITSPGEGAFTYDEGTLVEIVAEPHAGYQFVSWTGDVVTVADVEDADTTITMNGDWTITANFGSRRTLRTDSTDGGQVTIPGEGAFFYGAGAVVDLVAEAEAGYQFVNWTGDVATVADVNAASTTITINDYCSITANFEAIGGCFIATTAYGTPMAEEIQILREFRDKYLLTNPLGQGLVDIYYRISPPIAEFIIKHPTLKPIVRAGLMPAVAMSTVVVDTTMAEKTAIVGLLLVVSVALAVWTKRRRSRDPEHT